MEIFCPASTRRTIPQRRHGQRMRDAIIVDIDSVGSKQGARTFIALGTTDFVLAASRVPNELDERL